MFKIRSKLTKNDMKISKKRVKLLQKCYSQQKAREFNRSKLRFLGF